MSNITPPKIVRILNEKFEFESRFYFSDPKNALILVDVQNDFIPGGTLAVDRGDEIIPIINQIESHFNLVVATQDWHPGNHKSFASNHVGKNPLETILLNGQNQMLWPDHCVQGSHGAELSSALNKNNIEAIFRKGMDREIDSYSGFYDNDQKKSTGMAGYLKDREITNLYICGLAADYCVYYTALDGLSLDFEVTIIEDATRAITEAGYQAAKADLISKNCSFINSEDLHTAN